MNSERVTSIHATAGCTPRGRNRRLGRAGARAPRRLACRAERGREARLGAAPPVARGGRARRVTSRADARRRRALGRARAQRREAWLAGPTDAEKRSWRVRGASTRDGPPRRRTRGRGAGPPASAAAPGVARRSIRGRKTGLGGATERGRPGSICSAYAGDARASTDLPESAPRLLREAELAGKGAVYACRKSRRGSGPTWSAPAGASRTSSAQQPPRRRVRY